MTTRTLEFQREEFANRRFLATPLSGMLIWFIIAIVGYFGSPYAAVMSIYIGTGSIVYVGMWVSKFTGENFLAKSRPKNSFDTLFYFTVAQALLVYSIAIPFFLAEHTSLPLTVGILTGLMWLPFSWIINHWIGIFHAIVRTSLCLTTWHLFPDNRFVAVPLVIVLTYLFTIVVLERRWSNLKLLK